MTTFGISMVRDEADVIAGTLTHMADEVDHLVVADNGSVDGTREILAELEDTLPLTVLDDPELAYYQSEKLSRLAATASEQGAGWIVPFDADELWYAESRVSAMCDRSTVDVLEANLFNHFPSAVDPDLDDAFDRIVHRETSPAPLPKVAFRYRPGAVIHQGNHGVTLPGPYRARRSLSIRHFPYRSAEQFVRKARNGAAAYAATDLPHHVGQHWREYGAILERHGEQGLAAVFEEHFYYLAPSLSGLTHDPAPYLRWQR